MKYSGLIYRIYHWFAQIPPMIRFKTKDPLTPEEKQKIINLLASGYYIILTGNNYHLSSLFVKFMTLIKLKKKTRYSHVLMNCDFMEKPEDVGRFKFMEATVAGVHYSTFDEVFDCDTVCLLSPTHMKNERWTEVIDALLRYNGRPYDDLFQLADQNYISCVELVRIALMANNEYNENFAKFEEMIIQEGNLLPQMFRDCEDFKVVYEA